MGDCLGILGVVDFFFFDSIFARFARYGYTAWRNCSRIFRFCNSCWASVKGQERAEGTQLNSIRSIPMHESPAADQRLQGECEKPEELCPLASARLDRNGSCAGSEWLGKIRSSCASCEYLWNDESLTPFERAPSEGRQLAGASWLCWSDRNRCEESARLWSPLERSHVGFGANGT